MNNRQLKEDLLVTGHSAVRLEDMESDSLPTSLGDISSSSGASILFIFTDKYMELKAWLSYFSPE